MLLTNIKNHSFVCSKKIKDIIVPKKERNSTHFWDLVLYFFQIEAIIFVCLFIPITVGMATTMGFPFTAAQWKELERQAMIYKYMMASLPVPPDLLYSSFPTNFAPTFAPASYCMSLQNPFLFSLSFMLFLHVS